MVDLDSMKAQLAKYILKRRLDGGEFLYVYRPRGQSVAGKKAVLVAISHVVTLYVK